MWKPKVSDEDVKKQSEIGALIWRRLADAGLTGNEDCSTAEAKWTVEEAAGDIEDRINALKKQVTELESQNSAPIDMLLFCPACGVQHIDHPQPEKDWTNPPHRSHECQACGWVWRPADVPTNGVERIATHGSRDSGDSIYRLTLDHAAVLGREIDDLKATVKYLEGQVSRRNEGLKRWQELVTELVPFDLSESFDGDYLGRMRYEFQQMKKRIAELEAKA